MSTYILGIFYIKSPPVQNFCDFFHFNHVAAVANILIIELKGQIQYQLGQSHLIRSRKEEKWQNM